jgi:hypothetical protein
VASFNYKVANQYDKFKAKNVRIGLKNDDSRSKHVLVSARDLALGYGSLLAGEGCCGNGDVRLRDARGW